MEEQFVTKSDFAALCGVDKSRVSQWIKERKISGEAIVGTGRHARIRPAIAQEQLRTRLDAGQRTGNGFTTNLTRAVAANKAAVAALDAPESDDDLGSDDVDRRLKLAKLETVERSNRMAALEEAAAAGTYCDASEAATEMGKIAGQMMTTFGGWMVEFATAVSARFKLDHRDVLHTLNEQFRTSREQAAEAASARAAGLHATVEA